MRHAVVASSFGLRFQGQGYFLTDARTHRGTSGSPVVIRVAESRPNLGDLPWMPLGVHSTRIDLGSRDLLLDEALGLNCVPGLQASNDADIGLNRGRSGVFSVPGRRALFQGA